MAFGCSRWTMAGAGSSPPSSSCERRVSNWQVCNRGDRFAIPMQPISMGLAGLTASTASRLASYGGWPCGWITAPCICRDHCHQPWLSSGASSTPSSAVAPDQTRVACAVQSHAEGTDHPWSHLPCTYCELSGRRPRLRANSCQCPVDRRKERHNLKPRSSSFRRGNAAISNQARRVRH